MGGLHKTKQCPIVVSETTHAVVTHFCAICTAPCDGSRRDGEFIICDRCDDEHPRQGGYSFEGGRPDSRALGSGRASSIGEGNRRKGGPGSAP